MKVETKAFRVLDVGCGTNPKGNVNCDLYPNLSLHRFPHKKIELKAIPNFVRCDAHFLPFKDGSFETIIASHLLEHCEFPFLVLQEFRRVSTRKVIIEVPNLSKVVFRENPTHFFTWSEYSLQNLLDHFFTRVEIYNAYYRFRSKFLKKIPFFGKLICIILQQIINLNILAVAYK